MANRVKSIPVNTMLEIFGTGIAIGKASIKGLRIFEETAHSHRDDYHLFFLQETGEMPIEIDFQKHVLKPLSVIYIHPHQVHRIKAIENVTLSFLAINNENLHSENLKILEDITPAPSLPLRKEIFTLASDAVSLCIQLSEQKHERLYHDLLKNSCNTLVTLIASHYLAISGERDTLSRFEIINKSFKSLLAKNFTIDKSPAAYAKALHISSLYLNECVKKVTGHAVSYHIQQRVILEAKRLIYHTDKSVKEIASELGYDDYAYFSRLFTKIVGMTPLNFRKNLI